MVRGEVSCDELGAPRLTPISSQGEDARRSRRCIRVQTGRYLRAAGLKRPGISNHALRHYAGFRNRRPRRAPGARALRGTGVAADVQVWPQDDFNRQLHLKASFPSTVVREGKLLYGS